MTKKWRLLQPGTSKIGNAFSLPCCRRTPSASISAALDYLIEEFGVPDYIKIDAEGFDLEALRGLSRPVSLMSFEFNTLPSLIEIAAHCIEHVDSLGQYEFNYQAEAPGQTGLQFDSWVRPGVMCYTLRYDMSRLGLFGDIFARLPSVGPTLDQECAEA